MGPATIGRVTSTPATCGPQRRPARLVATTSAGARSTLRQAAAGHRTTPGPRRSAPRSGRGCGRPGSLGSLPARLGDGPVLPAEEVSRTTMPAKSRKADGTPKVRWSAADRAARGHAPRRRGGQPRKGHAAVSPETSRRPDRPVVARAAVKARPSSEQPPVRKPRQVRPERRQRSERSERADQPRFEQRERPEQGSGSSNESAPSSGSGSSSGSGRSSASARSARRPEPDRAIRLAGGVGAGANAPAQHAARDRVGRASLTSVCRPA